MSAILAKGVTVEALRKLADEFEAPPWATHVAVRFCGQKVAPAAWSAVDRAYLDEDPAGLKIGDWAGSFKEAYWHFFPIVGRAPQLAAAALAQATKETRDAG